MIFTADVKTAGSIAGTEVITKILLYYFHERLWALVPWGHGSREQPSDALTATATAP
jgi:uncharacterized membrane protein